MAGWRDQSPLDLVTAYGVPLLLMGICAKLWMDWTKRNMQSAQLAQLRAEKAV